MESFQSSPSPMSTVSLDERNASIGQQSSHPISLPFPSIPNANPSRCSVSVLSPSTGSSMKSSVNSLVNDFVHDTTEKDQTTMTTVHTISQEHSPITQNGQIQNLSSQNSNQSPSRQAQVSLEQPQSVQHSPQIHSHAHNASHQKSQPSMQQSTSTQQTIHQSALSLNNQPQAYTQTQLHAQTIYPQLQSNNTLSKSQQIIASSPIHSHQLQYSTHPLHVAPHNIAHLPQSSIMTNGDSPKNSSQPMIILGPRPSQLVLNISHPNNQGKLLDDIPIKLYATSHIHSRQNISIPRESLRVNMLLNSSLQSAANQVNQACQSNQGNQACQANQSNGKRKRTSSFTTSLDSGHIQQGRLNINLDHNMSFHSHPFSKPNYLQENTDPNFREENRYATLLPLKKRRKFKNSNLVTKLKGQHENFEMEKFRTLNSAPATPLSSFSHENPDTPLTISDDTFILNESASFGPSDCELNQQRIESNLLSQLPRSPLTDNQLEQLQLEIRSLSESLRPTLMEGTKRGTVKKRECLAQKKIHYALELNLNLNYVNILLREVNIRLRTRVNYTRHGSVKIRDFYNQLKAENPEIQWRKLFSSDLPEKINEDFAVPYRFAALLYTHIFPGQTSVLHYNSPDAHKIMISPDCIVDDQKLAERAVCCHCLLQLIPGKGRRGSGNLPRHKKKTCRAIGIKKPLSALKINVSHETDSESSPYPGVISEQFL